MLTFFTTAKPFRGHSAIIQRNALQSWKLLHPEVEVILFGDEEGAAEVCAELGLRHEPHVERDEGGLKYVGYIFGRAQEIARHGYLCYSNCDILLLPDFWTAFQRLTRWRKSFLLVGRRWDTDVTEPIDFTTPDWSLRIQKLVRERGVKRKPTAIDFFLFSRGLYDHVPALVNGRSFWDWWLVWYALSRREAVVDCTPVATVVHQNHDYAYHPKGWLGTHTDEAARRNLQLLGGMGRSRTIADATEVLTPGGLNRNWRRYWATLATTPRAASDFVRYKVCDQVWFALLGVTRPVRARLGLRAGFASRLRRGRPTGD
jgi:hypothetical protein